MTTENQFFSKDGTRYVYLDGRICADIEMFYSDIARQLEFPDYFGRNLDALDEMLNDLDWVEEQNVHILLYHAFAFLSAQEEHKESVLQILTELEGSKAQFSVI